MSMPAFDLIAVGAINIDYVEQIDDDLRSQIEFERRIPKEEAIEIMERLDVDGSIGGSAFNTVRAVAALNAGLNVGFVGVLGTDGDGAKVVGEIERLSISTEFIKPVPDSRPGACVARVYSGTGARNLKTSPFANKGMASWLGELRNTRVTELADAKVVHITSLFDNDSANELAELVDAIARNRRGGAISFDPGYAWVKERRELVHRILRHTDILFLNEDELGILAGQDGDPPTKKMARKVLDQMAPTAKIIILKAAAQVTSFVIVGGECEAFEFPRTELAGGQLQNPVGTGDAMAAGYLASLLTKSSHFGPVALGQRLARSRLLMSSDAEFQERAEQEFRMLTRSLEQMEEGPGSKVFIGHGRASDWLELDRFLTKKLGLKCIEFDDDANAGKTTVERIDEMVDMAGFAFLIMTAEDQLVNGDMQARPNVLHEVGLFQGKLGRRRAIVLLEEGCKEPSNIYGLQHIPFTRGRMSEKFEKIRETLEEAGLVPKAKARHP